MEKTLVATGKTIDLAIEAALEQLKNRDAIARFTRQGGSFGISTGRGPINAKQMLPNVELNAWSVVLNGGEAYNYQLGAVASPIHLDKAAAETLMAWVIEQLPEVNIMLCTEEKLLFPSNPDYADRHFVETHQPMDMVTLEEAKAYNWMKILRYYAQYELEGGTLS